MIFTVLSVLFTSVFVIFILWLAWRAAQQLKTSNDFFFGSQSSQGRGFAINAALTNFNLVSALIILPQLAITYGYSAQWVIWSGVLGVVAFGIPGLFPVPKLGAHGERVTLHAYVSGDGSWALIARRLAAFVTILAYCGFVGATLVSLGRILSNYFVGQAATWVIGLVILSGAYLTIGGFDAIKKIDRLYVVIVAAGLLLLLGCLAKGIDNETWSLSVGGGMKGSVKYSGMPNGLVCALFLLNVFWQFVAFDMWERSYSIPENKRFGGFRAAFLGGLFFFLMLILFLFLGLAESQMDIGDPNAKASYNPFMYFIDNLAKFIPGHITLLNCLSFLFLFFGICVHLSTADTYLSSAGLALYKDFVNGDSSTRKISPVNRCRLAVVAVALVSGLIGVAIAVGFWPASLTDILISVFSIQLLLLPVLIYRRYFSEASGSLVNTALHTIWSILFGLFTYAVFSIAWFNKPDCSYWIPAIGILGSTVGLLTWEFWRVWIKPR